MKKLNLIFTLDYEIHGNGDGSPYDLMIEPTYRLLDLLEKYNTKLTIMADVAEILCFKEYYEKNGTDLFAYEKIVTQLQDAIKRGHDVQLHIHSSYFKARFDGKSWAQYWPEYNMASLQYERINEMIKVSKWFLEDILKPIKSVYSCFAFRAANWSMMPTPNIYKTLVENGILLDTSVYKGGQQKGNVDYDYSTAYSHLYSYRASESDINKPDENGLLTESPIYTEMRYFWSFLTPVRVFRMIRARFHKHQSNQEVSMTKEDSKGFFWQSFFKKNPWKLDFNQASGKQLINALKRIKKQTRTENSTIDIVLIGHSKTFISYNEKTLEKFLYWTNKQNDISSSTFIKQ